MAAASTWMAPTAACAPLAPRLQGSPPAASTSPAAEPELGWVGNIYYLSRWERRAVQVKGPFAHPSPLILQSPEELRRRLVLRRGGAPLLLVSAMG